MFVDNFYYVFLERIARVNAVWEQMNVRVPAKLPKSPKNKPEAMESPIQKSPPVSMLARPSSFVKSCCWSVGTLSLIG